MAFRRTLTTTVRAGVDRAATIRRAGRRQQQQQQLLLQLKTQFGIRQYYYHPYQVLGGGRSRSRYHETRGELGLFRSSPFSTTTPTPPEDEVKVANAKEERLNEYANILNEAARKGLAKESLKVISLLRTHELEPRIEHWNAALVANLSDAEGVANLTQEIKESGLPANMITYAALIRAAEIAEDGSTAMMYTKRMVRLFQRGGEERIRQIARAHKEMTALNLAQPAVTVTTLVAELVEKDQLKRAMDVLVQSQTQGTKSSVAVMELLANAYEMNGMTGRAATIRASASANTVLCYEDLAGAERENGVVAADETDESATDFDYYERMSEENLSPKEEEKAWEWWEKNPTTYFG